MRALKDIPSNRVVCIDIETARLAERLTEVSEDVQIAWAYKNKQDGKLLEDFELATLWEQKASLYAEFAKVISISLVFTDKTGEKCFCQNFTSDNEVELLQNLSDAIERMTKTDPRYRLVGHAAKTFDYPFLSKRMIITGVEIPKMLDSSGLKPWEVMNLCTNELWKMGGMHGSSLVAMCAALGVPISKDEMAGHEVGEAFYQGRLEDIGDYCDKDTISTFNCFRRFKGEAVFRFEDVIRVGGNRAEASDAQAVAEIPQMEALKALYLTKEFSDSIKEEIRDRFLNRDKKVMKKEWPMLQEVLTRLFINTEMFKADKPAVAAEKEQEVIAFVEQLKNDYYHG